LGPYMKWVGANNETSANGFVGVMFGSYM
jgi:hypothetical protein